MFGATTLIIAISALAALLPATSIIQAALSVSRRAMSIMAARLGDALARHALLGDRAAEGDARGGALAHQLERALGQADQAHAVVDAARSEAALRDLEAAAFAEQDVADRHAHVLEEHLHVAVRRVVVAEHRQRPHDRDARRVGRHQDHRLLRVARRVGVGLAHEDVDLQRGSPAPRGPPLAAVDDVVVALALDARLRCWWRRDEATSGSVIAKALRILPSSSGSSQCFLCSSLP